MKALFCVVFCSMAFSSTILVPDEYMSISEAISASVSGDSILVSHGNYLENIDYSGKEIAIIAIEGPEVTAIVSQAISTPVVLIISGEGPEAVLEGFTVTNGTSPKGGGIRIVNSSPLIINNIITNNTSRAEDYSYGGGIYAENSSSVIVGNYIHNNSAQKIGTDNTYGYAYGGGVYAAGSQISLLNNRIESNSVEVNSWGFGAGAGVIAGGAEIVANNIIAYNDDNSSDVDGYGISASGCELVNNTIVGNKGLGIKAALSVTNCIVWSNNLSGSQISEGITVTYSDVMYGYTGEGNFSALPEFTNGPLSSFHLDSGVSPCIDAGNPWPEYNDPEDLPGEARWPSYGTELNDTGAYGGPGAAYWTEGYTSVEETSAASVAPGSLQAAASENPVQGIPAVSFHLNSSALVELRIFDVSGRVVHRSSGQFSQGANSLSAEPLPPGLYSCLVTDGALAETVRFIVIR